MIVRATMGSPTASSSTSSQARCMADSASRARSSAPCASRAVATTVRSNSCDSGDELVLGGEVVEQAALGDAGARRDGVEGGRALALLAEQLREGVEDAVAGGA